MYLLEVGMIKVQHYASSHGEKVHRKTTILVKCYDAYSLKIGSFKEVIEIMKSVVKIHKFLFLSRFKNSIII